MYYLYVIYIYIVFDDTFRCKIILMKKIKRESFSKKHVISEFNLVYNIRAVIVRSCNEHVSTSAQLMLLPN